MLSKNSFSPLPCQIISKYNLPKQLILSESFYVEEQISECQPKINESENCSFILSAVSALPNPYLTNRLVMQVAFLPFIPKPVTGYSTVYTLLKNFNVLFHLEQEALSVFCDEGVYRIVAGIMLNKPNEFRKLIPFLGGFHMAKCTLHCFWKVIRGSGLEDGLTETGKKSTETVFGETSYMQSFRGLLIVESVMNRIKWIAFNDESNENNNFESSKEQLNLLQEALASKTPDECKSNFEECLNKISHLMKTFNKFVKNRKAISQLCAYFEQIFRYCQENKKPYSCI